MIDFPPLYLRNLYLKNVRTFEGEYIINLCNGHDKPAQWSVIIGNNNTGKTTILRALADLEPRQIRQVNSLNIVSSEEFTVPNYGFKHLSGSTDIIFPSLFGEVDSDPDKAQSHVLCNLYIRKSLEDKFYSSEYDSYRPLPIQDRPYEDYSSKYNWRSYDWGFNERSWRLSTGDANMESLKLFCYGPSRRISSIKFQSEPEDDNTIGLYRDIELLNIEEWLLQTDYAIKNGSQAGKWVLSKIEEVIFGSGILPDVNAVRFTTDDLLKSFIEVETRGKWVRLRDLSYGYQSVIAWLVDLTKRMLDRYPAFDNPLHGPAIVLVDEIDLHLHPEWQRKIIKYLSDLFPNTQFIVTAHSPLIVQSAENVNLIMLEKDDETGSINIRQQFGSFQGWTVEEILRELMDLGDKTRSDRFLKLLGDFEKGLDQGDYDKAKAAYDDLDKILHPASSQRKLLSIQLSSLVPA